MERYNYIEEMKKDITEWMSDNEYQFSLLDALGADGESDLVDLLFCEDSITGNASGSYFCDAWEAEEALCHNWNLLHQALAEFSFDDPIGRGAESMDVILRCYLLPDAVYWVLNDIRVHIHASARDHMDAAKDLLSRASKADLDDLMNDEITQFVMNSMPAHTDESILAYYLAIHESMCGEEFTI